MSESKRINMKRLVLEVSSLFGELAIEKVNNMYRLTQEDDMLYFTPSEIIHKTGPQTFYTVLGRKYQTTLSLIELKQSLNKLDAEYGERARKAEANEGIDWKALSHACRGGLQLLEIYKTGDLIYPLQDAPFILDVKLGKHPFKTVQEFLEDVVDQVEAASTEASKNGMQQKVDMSFWMTSLRRCISKTIEVIINDREPSGPLGGQNIFKK